MSVHLQTQTSSVDSNANSQKVRPLQHTKKLQRSLSENDKDLSKIITENKQIKYGSGFLSLRRCSKDQRSVVKEIIDLTLRLKKTNRILSHYLESSDVSSSSETEESEYSSVSSSSET
jgi:hypothetical protein